MVFIIREILKHLKKIIKWYDSFEENLLAVSLAVTVTVIFVQVIARHVFNSSLSWSEEFARYVFIWQIWLGTSMATRERTHVKVEILQGMLGKKGNCVLNITGCIGVLVFAFFLVHYGYLSMMSIMGRHAVSTAMRIPLWIVYLSLPVGNLLVCLRMVVQIIEEIGKMTALLHSDKEDGGELV